MLLITDLDNTLYDWVTFFSRSFQAMLSELSELLGVPEQQLQVEFKAIHQRYGNSEQPFAALELPSVRERFPNRSRHELLKELQGPLQAFNRERRSTLRLYPGVRETLEELSQKNLPIVAHTEALAVNACHRLRLLGIDHYFQRLYTLRGKLLEHPDPGRRGANSNPPADFICEVPPIDRKPNPRLLRDICTQEGISPCRSWYVGDSLVRDVSMAKRAGVQAVWARYGTRFSAQCWETLVSVTHWTDEDVRRERRLKQLYSHVEPDFVVDSFNEVGQLVMAPLPELKSAVG